MKFEQDWIIVYVFFYEEEKQKLLYQAVSKFYTS